MIEICPYFKTCKSFAEVTTRYMQALRGAGPDEVNMAIVLKEYLHKESSAFLKFVEKQELQIFETLSNLLPGDFCVYGRKKSLYSYITKLQSAFDVRSVKDVYAIRVVIDDSRFGIETAVDQCYIAAKALIKYYQGMDYTPEPLTEKDCDGDLEENVNIYTPEPEKLPEFIHPYLKYMKDYISRPKRNGYQSIHLRFIKDGRSIDVQIRTSTMDEYSESGHACHDGVYKPVVTYDDLKGINIDGFEYDENGNILLDEHGIFKPLPIGSRLDTRN